MNGYVAEIRVLAGNFAPKEWALCQKQVLSVATDIVLFSLLGTFYGGNGQTSFMLPDLRGKVSISSYIAPDIQYHYLGKPMGLNLPP